MPRRTMLLALLACLLGSAGLTPAAQASPLGAPTVVASGLEFPWEVVPLPDGRVLVTERPGRVRVIEPSGALRAAPAYADPSAAKFLGLAPHPSYATNRLVYLYVSYGSGANPNANRVIRLRDDGTNLVEPATIFQGGIRSDGNHDGGRIKFGPDRKLYVSTGDVHDPSLPQDLGSFNGKILRMEAPGGPGDGAPAAGNPFSGAGAAPYVWSYGHRHPQGLDWDASGRMWETEHGPSGESYANGRGSRDEINRIDRGANYGWPLIMGTEQRDGMRAPVVSSGDSTTWAPGGLAFGPDLRMYVPMLAGTHLRELGTSGDGVTDQIELYKNAYGRMRAATADSTHLWLTTSNDDADGDEVLRVPIDPATIPRAPATREPPPPTALRRAGAREILDALLLAQARALRRRGVRGLLRRGRLSARAAALPAGRMSLRLYRPRAPGRRAVRTASGAGPVTRSGTVAVRAPITRPGRVVLRRAIRRRGRMRVVLRAGLKPSTGRALVRRRSVIVRRR